jgi:hypothetical protein
LLEQFVAADSVTGFLSEGKGSNNVLVWRVGLWGLIQETIGMFVGAKQGLNACAQLGVFPTRSLEVRGALPFRQLQQRPKNRLFAILWIVHRIGANVFYQRILPAGREKSRRIGQNASRWSSGRCAVRPLLFQPIELISIRRRNHHLIFTANYVPRVGHSHPIHRGGVRALLKREAGG